jgi:hypothetical protein
VKGSTAKSKTISKAFVKVAVLFGVLGVIVFGIIAAGILLSSI